MKLAGGAAAAAVSSAGSGSTSVDNGNGAHAMGANKAPCASFRLMPWQKDPHRCDEMDQQADDRSPAEIAMADAFAKWPLELWCGDGGQVRGIFAYL